MQFNFFRSYPSNCYQCCKSNNTLADWRKIIAGVPQGSMLGPLLLNIFSSDVSFFLKDAYLGNYAYDSTLCPYNEKRLKTVIFNLRQAFSILSNWFYDNCMVLNPGRCDFMLCGVKENEQFDLICNGITLKHSSYDKILSAAIDNKLSFDEHIINI